tara:strand:+ start:72 stop:278 length:207 start_codon:yes stop_codon:yes gene_type:complete
MVFGIPRTPTPVMRPAYIKAYSPIARIIKNIPPLPEERKMLRYMPEKNKMGRTKIIENIVAAKMDSSE